MNILTNFLNKRIMPFYSVARGRQPGVYETWSECQAQVTGFSAPIFKKFSTKHEAEQHCISNGGSLQKSTSSISTNSTTAVAKLVEPKKQQKRTAILIEPTVPCKKSKYEIINPVKMKKYGKYAFMEDDKGYVNVYTDGSCEGNGRAHAAAGLGVYFGEGHALNTSAPVSGRATNNCGEIQATTIAIKLAAQSSITKLNINTDSKFVIDSVTKWMSGWKKRGWKLASGQPVKNETDFKELDKALATSGVDVKWNYVKAHNGTLGNERADSLAREGSKMYRMISSDEFNEP